MKPLVLLIRDGWGVRDSCEGNPLCTAKIPYTKKLLALYPTVMLAASGEAVGLPKGYQGNSEVGHLTIGSGRKVYQSLARINHAIEDGTFMKNQALLDVIEQVKAKGTQLHIVGLVQDEGVHAHNGHIIALLRLAHEHGLEDVLVHAITDGRDTPPKSAHIYLEQLQRAMHASTGRFGVLVGRYFAMDRDTRWERTKVAYDAIIDLKGESALDWMQAIDDAYEQDQTDEFIKPRILKGYRGIQEGDGFIFANYRYDRARQLTKAFIEPMFDGFPVKHPSIHFVAMTEYYHDIPCEVVFSPQDVSNDLGSTISASGLSQLRISETEKYAHVTFFFNGLKEHPYRAEDRVMIPSPKVATYDLKPEMSVHAIKDHILTALDHKTHDVIITNFVNGDMVGHTGNYDAVVKAVEAVDVCMEAVVDKVLSVGGTAMITADHGNCEELTGKTQTSHTTNPVHCIFVTDNKIELARKEGGLEDIAPTMLHILDIEKPSEMTGTSLIRKSS